MERFEIIIFRSDENQAFVGDLPELPGCMAHGDTHEPALAAVKQAKGLWQENVQATGRAIPQARGGRLLFA